MTAHRFSFYAPALSATDASVDLVDDEHHHLTRVLRMTPGEVILVTNGRGLIVSAVVDSIRAQATTARVARIEGNDPSPPRLELALGLLPRTHVDTALAQCVEAGITAFVPVLARRGHVRAPGAGGATRLARVAVAAMKQSGRAWLPAIEAPVDVDALAARCSGFARVVLADADAPERVAAGAAPVDTLAIVGPEAGFTAEEISLLTGAGARPASLSAHRLRAETAAIVLISMLALCRRV